MKTKIHTTSGEAYATFERGEHSMYIVTVRDNKGNLHDKIRCDDYKEALCYWASFKKIADNLANN